MNNRLFRISNVNYKDIVSYPEIEILSDKVTFISGESGCGKSTLLKLLNGIISPTTGEIEYMGVDINKINPIMHREEVLLISQDVYLFDTTIEENFKEFYEYRGEKPPSEELMSYYMKLCALDLPKDKDTKTMSGGERQRLYIAIFLSLAKETVLLDEPTSALDEGTGNEVIGNIIKHCKEKNLSLIVVSHDMAITERFSEQKILLRKEGK